ncbi:hypothetical protein C0992_011075 [Termitomyces sp. T32_za158]|nr:hypothetical protein C0992_011075 [Termitomyces sp. T32_za158]
MAFSGALTLSDLNDFIGPSQACIKPVTQANSLGPEKDPGAAATAIQIDQNGAYYEVTQDDKDPAPAPVKKLEQAQVNLNDCLACSGCITSAESVLITLQSHTEVLTFLESNKKKLYASSIVPNSEPYKIPVISISPQTLSSLAAAIASSSTQHPTPRQVLRRIRAFCTESLGFALVFDTTFARHLVLREHIAEFQERWHAAKQESRSGVTSGSTGESAKGLPMLASACPGWICYAEKAHSEMLPFISRTKSPQQVMGTLVKNWMSVRWGKVPSEIYHVTVMPCYDKKLEASRTDFYNDVYSTRDVDCVITTGELERLMIEKSWDIMQPVPGELDDDLPTSSSGAFDPFLNVPHLNPANSANVPTINFPELLVHPGSSSGSYLHEVIAHLQASSDVPLTLHVQAIRGTDYEEYTLTKCTSKPGNGDIVFKGAKCYGFRNLQNVVRRIGRERGVRIGSGAAGKLSGRSGAGVARRLAGRKVVEDKEKKDRGYDYVEVMACPGGCVNGGGQLKPAISPSSTPRPPAMPTTDSEGYQRNWEESGVAVVSRAKSAAPVDVAQSARWGSKEWTKKVEEEYWREPFADARTQLADGLARRIYDDMCGFRDGIVREETRRRFFRTEYRAVESEVLGLAVVW